MADAKLEIILAAKDAASQTVNQASRQIQSQLTTLERRAADFARNWLQVTAAIYGLGKAWDEIKLGARIQQERQAFDNLARSHGANADMIIAKLKEASANTVDTMTLINKAGTAMMMGIDPEKINKLMEIARATSRMTGQTISQAFSDISLAVGRQSKMILDNLGIIVSVEKANEDYAAALNKTAAELTDVDRKQAFLNATIKNGEDLIRRMGNTQRRTAAEMFQSWEALSKNVRAALAEGMVTAVKYVVTAYTLAGSSINQIFEQIAQGWAYIIGFIGTLPGGELLGFKALGESLQNIADHFRAARIAAYGFADELMNLAQPQTTMVMPGMTVAGTYAADAQSKTNSEYERFLRECDRLHQEAIRSLKDMETQSDNTWGRMEEWLKRNAQAEQAFIDLAQKAHEEAVNSLGNISTVNMAERLEEALGDPDAYFGKITDGAKTMSQDLRDAITGWASGFSKTLSDMVWDADASFSDIAESFGRMLTQMAMQRFIVTPFLDWFGGLFPSAQGNVINNGAIVPYAKGGVVTQPILFPMARGMGLMGEAGPEAVMPLTRLPGGDLGVKAQTATTAPNVKVVVNNNTGQQAQVRQEGPKWNGQDWVIGVWLDAYHRNKGGLRSALGV